MRLVAWTHEDFFALGKAIFRNMTGVVYPFAARTTQRAFLVVQSMFAASANMEMIRAVKAGSLEGLRGVLLDRRAMENEAVREPPTAARVSGRFRPIGGSWPVAISIPPDTIFIRKATATQSEIAFRTEAAALIPATAAESNLVYGVALATGDRANGIPTATALSLRQPIAGVADFLTASESAGGYDRESDANLRTRARAARRAHGQCTWLGIENLLTTVEITGGQRVRHAALFEEFAAPAPSVVGVIYAIIDDGTGQAASIGSVDATTYGYGTGNWFEYESNGNVLYVDLPKKALEVWNDGVNATLERDNGAGYVAQTEGIDYWVDSDRGQIVLASPLTITQKIRCQFSFYDGLVQAAAGKLTGEPDDLSNRGWRPVGYSIRVRPPFSVTNPTVSATLTFKSGFDSAYGRTVAADAVAAYLNDLPIGKPARYNRLSGILHQLPGIDEVDDLLLAGATSDVAPTHPYGVVRGNGTLTF